MSEILRWARGVMDSARHDHGVDPLVFLVIFLAASPVFYYSLFRLVRALARREQRGKGLWSAVFLVSTAAPYLYVLAFGRNLPVWVYGVLALLAVQCAWSLARTLKGKSGKPPAGPGVP
ncbi:MAG TPA: hypothetical protein VLH39_03525 [Magnetospirillaceae bacterium]|nr:hypothetical protein [Magnetospirillaceae bacterium]